ncbi:MAG TPA: BamA/TamA family outer membrane protein, partial [Gemmatimonadales bacterium]|nr:BamA/TamA family outer membrane protein [Gemmatimonadales bacterium]
MKKLTFFPGSVEGRIRFLLLALALDVMVWVRPALSQDEELRRPMVRELAFEGNRALDDYLLRNSIATSNSSWWARVPLLSGLGQKRYFDEREFQRDVLRLELLYSQSGFLEASIDTVVRRDSSAVYIRFVIDEGEPVRVSRLTIAGVGDILPGERLLGDLPLRVGDPFDRFRLRASTDTIVSSLRNHGYPFVEVFRGFEVDSARRSATVTFDVEPGPRATVAAVEVENTRALGPDLVRRLVPLRAGRVYRESDIYRSQRDLYRTGVYDYVDVHLVDSLLENPADSQVTVRIRVREGPLNRLRLGWGYGTLDCFRVLAGWTAHHALGGARTLELSARLSKIGTGEPFTWGLEQSVCRGLRTEEDSSRLALNYNITAALTEPILFSRGTSGTISLFGERRSELLAFVREAVGGELSVSRRLAEGLPVTLSYRLERASTRAEPATFCVFLNICRDQDIAVFEEPLLLASLGVLAVRNRQNSILNPSRGSLASAEVQWAATAIGSDSLAEFAKLQAQYAMYLPVSRRGVLAWRVQYAAIIPATFALRGQSLRFVPPGERFYSGGPNSVRGYGQNEMGPVVRVIETRPDGDGGVEVDTLTSASGGNDLSFGNVELRFPLPVFGGRLEGAVFVDAGQLRVRGEEPIRTDGVRVTPGVGLRLVTAIGPIR